MIRLRRLSNCVFVATLIAWLLAMAIYIRSKFRADVITSITSSRHCIVIASVDGTLDIIDQSPWPAPRQFQWTSGAADYNPVSSNAAPDTLRGPEISWQDMPSSLMKTRRWKSIRLAYGQTSLFSVGDPPSINQEWRGIEGSGGFRGPGPSFLHFSCYELSAPIWILPATTAIVPGLWLALVFRHRLRRRLRLRHGRCIHCGYDLRQTPTRCPECGTSRIANTRLSPTTPVSPACIHAGLNGIFGE